MDDRQREKPRVRTLAKRRSEAAQKITYLPEGYVPGPDDVMLGRSGESINHIGNQRFRQMVDGCVEKYVGLQKLQKTLLIDELVQRVRQRSPHGGFIKKDKMTGRFYEVGDHMAREKTSQAFRNASIDATYRSSTKSKQLRRNAQRNREVSLPYTSPEFARLPGVSSAATLTYASSQSIQRLDSYEKMAKSCPEFSSSSEASSPDASHTNQGWKAMPPEPHPSNHPVTSDHLFARAQLPRAQAPSPLPYPLEPNMYAQEQQVGHHHRPSPPPMLLSTAPFGQGPTVAANYPPMINPALSQSFEAAQPSSLLSGTSTMRDKVTHTMGGGNMAFLDSQTPSPSNEEKAKQSPPDDQLFEKLLQATEGYSTSGDPFNPRPLPDDPNAPR